MKKGWRIAMWVSLFIGGFLLMGLVVQSLWNWLLPEIMGWKMISYWQAMGLLILSKILFKGFFWNGGRWGNGRWSNHHWKSKWQSMSAEDREKFKQKMRERCSWTSQPESKETNAQ
jgi:hypothetical protein